MSTMFSFRQIRAAVQQISSAVNASQEYSRANDPRYARDREAHGAREWASYIPL